jgi:hypothetical protein
LIISDEDFFDIIYGKPILDLFLAIFFSTMLLACVCISGSKVPSMQNQP